MRSPLVRKLRLITGLILFAYVCSHLINLALGLWSLEIMDAVRPVFMKPWQNKVGVVVLFGSLAVHMVLGIVALYQRGTLRMSSFDTLQLAMSLVLPPLMVLHVLGTWVASMMVDFGATYTWLMVLYWKLNPWAGLRQVLVVVVAWIHGCMGVYYWVRLHRWWPRWRGALYPLVFLVPVAALLGFVEAGKEALVLVEDPDWMAGVYADNAALDDATTAALYRMQSLFISGYLLALCGVLVARWWRLRLVARRDRVQVTYVDGATVESTFGLSLLEISRAEDVSHTSICGGKGRCGTCRVRVIEGLDFLPEPNAIEAGTLRRMGAAPDVRLACQSIPHGSPLTLERIVSVDATAETAFDDPAGVEA